MIRTEVASKIEYFYSRTLADLQSALDAGSDLLLLLGLNAANRSTSSAGAVEKIAPNGHRYVEIDAQASPPYNEAILVHEIMDDFWCAYLCIGRGFFKQTGANLRSTVESLVQLFRVRLISTATTPFRDEWVNRRKGIVEFTKGLSVLEPLVPPESRPTFKKLGPLYDHLCKSTHTHKDHSSTFITSGMESRSSPRTFDPMAFVRVRACFATTLQTVLSLLLSLYSPRKPDMLAEVQVFRTLKDMHDKTSAFNPTILAFEKQKLIRNEHVLLSTGKQILYSLSLEGHISGPLGRLKLVSDDRKHVHKTIDRRLLTDRW